MRSSEVLLPVLRIADGRSRCWQSAGNYNLTTSIRSIVTLDLIRRRASNAFKIHRIEIGDKGSLLGAFRHGNCRNWMAAQLVIVSPSEPSTSTVNPQLVTPGLQ